MNCKKGDLAIIVVSFAGNEGKIVRCVEFIPELKQRERDGIVRVQGPGWYIDQQLPGVFGKLGDSIADAQLRPLRDSDGDDETFTWAGKPNKITVNA